MSAPSRNRQPPRVGPPALAAALLRWIVPAGLPGESLMGDLVEEYGRRRLDGRIRADVWYWWTVFQVGGAYCWSSIRGLPSRLQQDLRFAARSFRRDPGFTLAAAATLAVGIGVTTSVFSVADTLLLRPLPLPEADRLVRVHATEPLLSEFRNVVSGATYLDWRSQARSFEGLAAYRNLSFNLLGGESPERIAGVSITSNFFEVLGVGASLGRTPRAEDIPTGARTVVIAHSLWRSRFGADPAVLGETMNLNGVPHLVLGIMPPDFEFPEDTELFVPSPHRVPETPGSTEDMSSDRGAQYLSVVGRLANGVELSLAQAEMDAISAVIASTFPETSEDEGVSVVVLRDDIVGETRATLLLLLGSAALVMMIACANVANLLAVRASRRSRELTVRTALGAGVNRLRGQLLTESVLLSGLGSLPGIILAVWGTKALVTLAPKDLPRVGEIAVDTRVLAFTALLALVTGLLFGLAPLVGLSDRHSRLAAHLRGGSSADRARGRLRDTVVVAEVALSLLLLIGAGLMARTFQELYLADPGFDPRGTLVAHVSLPPGEYDDDAALTAFYEEALDGIGSLPGVESAATVLTLPMHWVVRGTFSFSIERRTLDGSDPMLAGYQVVSSEYFSTLGIPVTRGRGIEHTDRSESNSVAVINEALARRYWPDSDPLGERLTFWGDPDDPETEWATVVGVVGNTALDGLDRPPVPEVFLAASQFPMNRSTFVVRTAGEPAALAPGLRQALAEVDPNLPLYGVSSMEGVVSDSLSRRRFLMLLLGLFAGAALLMAAVGLYGVLASSVAQRVREIGIRRALGAPPGEVVLRVVRQGFARVCLGLTVGLMASLGLSRFIESQIYGVSALDVVTYAASVLLLAAIAALACWVPAVRAVRIDPVEATRAD